MTQGESAHSLTKLRAKKSYGQHFLTDGNLLRKIVSLADVTKDDTVIEVGPGRGALTLHLAEQARRLICIEKDSDLVPLLQEQFAQQQHVEIIEHDILTWEPPRELTTYKVVANIPYYITTPIIEYFLEGVTKHPSILVLLVQKEFAERAVAKAPRANSLSMMLASLALVTIGSKVPKHMFQPAPKVDSALLLIRPNQKQSTKAFRQFLHQGFSQKRKKLKSSLKPFLTSSTKHAALLERRAETLTLDEWMMLYEDLTSERVLQ